ncbi:MAG: Clp1/GlmU family protein [archaeon]
MPDENMQKKTLATGNTLVVSGPASLALIEGEATIFGAPVELRERIVVREEKQLALEAQRDCIIETALGKGAELSEAQGSTIPDSWKQALEETMQIERPKIVVIGHVDSGKSAMCTCLVNAFAGEHPKLALVDADLGQADIGPPAVLSLATTDECLFSLSELEPAIMVFIGHTSPALVKSQVVEGLQKLLESNPCPEEPLIVNTDGWIGEEDADLFKAKIISLIEPDLVIGIERQTGELHKLTSLIDARSILVKSSSVVKTRTREERRRLRELSYRRFLEGGTLKSVDFRKIPLKGILVRDNRLRGVCAKINSLVGFLNEWGFLINIGVLVGVNQRAGLMKILTKFNNDPSTIELGDVKIDQHGHELIGEEL